MLVFVLLCMPRIVDDQPFVVKLLMGVFMRNFNGSLLHSASDLNAYLGCPHSVSLSLRKLLDPASLPERAQDDEQAKLIAEAGNQHEAAYLDQLRHEFQVDEIDDRIPLEERGSCIWQIAARTAGM